MDSVILFQAIYPFSGDISAHQLTFAKGAILRVQPQHATAAKNGWTWGSITEQDGRESAGWFPTGYAILTSAPTVEPPSLPWISSENENRNTDGDFSGSVLGGHSPALDYLSVNPAFHPTDASNPFTNDHTSPLDHLNGDDRITIVATPRNHKMGERLQKQWKHVGSMGNKLLPRRRVAAEDSTVPSVSITPASGK